MKKIYIILSIIVVLLIGFLGITYSYEYNENHFLKFELVGEYELNLLLNEEYIEYGVKVTNNQEDISSLVKIDSSMVDTSKVGEYYVKYLVDIDGVEEYIYRIVKVTENVRPEIFLKGEEIMYIDTNGSYIEPGYEVFDNYDVDIYSRVVITSNLDVSKNGEYIVEYKVTDSSGNENKVTRKIIVR